MAHEEKNRRASKDSGLRAVVTEGIGFDYSKLDSHRYTMIRAGVILLFDKNRRSVMNRGGQVPTNG
jgi:hypothetical protein